MKLDRIFPWATAYVGILGLTSGLFAIAAGIAAPGAPGDLIELLYKVSLVAGTGALLTLLLGLASLVFAGGYRLVSAAVDDEAAVPEEE